ncbi:MAG: GT-D fold domain-containing protein [Lachnospiraceae bacterium]|nr:GT-D fold domain-containing protein [Lachnospiraceae bacterium]
MGYFKDRGMYFLSEFVYMLYEKKVMKNRISVNSIDDTIDKLIHSMDSFVRFGDGEIQIIEGNGILLQDYDKVLAERLYEILQYRQEHVLVGIPDIFGSLEQYTDKSKSFWKEHLFLFRKTYLKYCNTDRVYENAFFSRLYYIYKDKEQSGKWFERVREIWRDKNVVIVEGEGTHTGVGNDLMDTAAGVERILCPGTNAYRAYPEIRKACLSLGKDKLFLLAVGNTAKLLVSDLAKEGYRAIDIGNLDLEYEWYLHKDVQKEKVKKHSIIGRVANEEAGYYAYLSEVKEWIM